MRIPDEVLVTPFEIKEKFAGPIGAGEPESKAERLARYLALEQMLKANRLHFDRPVEECIGTGLHKELVDFQRAVNCQHDDRVDALMFALPSLMKPPTKWMKFKKWVRENWLLLFVAAAGMAAARILWLLIR